MAEIVRYVNTASSGGDGTTNDESGANAAYATLAAWDEAEATNLVGAGNWHHVYVTTGSGTTADTTAVLVGADWTTGAANYILIEAASGDEAVKTGWDTARYRLEVSNADALTIYADFVRVQNLQIRNTRTSGFYYSGINISLCTAGATYTITGNRIETVSGGANACSPITLNDADLTATLTNNILVSTDTDTDDRAALITVTGTAYIYNNVIRGNAGNVDGINVRSGATATIKNNAIFNLGDDISNSGTATVQYNAADDDLDTEFTETTNIQPGGAWTAEFTDPANGDFTILVGSALKTAGIGPGSDAAVPTPDIDGDTRSGATCSIGVDEYVAAGGTQGVTTRNPLWGPLGGPLVGVIN